MSRKRYQIYNKLRELWLQNNNIEICLTHIEGKSVNTEKVFRTLKNKIYNFMASILRNSCIIKLYDEDNEWNKAYHRTMKMKPIDVRPRLYIDFSVESNNKDPKSEVVCQLEMLW